MKVYQFQQNVTVVCEGSRAWLQCEPGHHVKITRAFWGREDFHTCADHPSSSNMTAFQLAADVDSDRVASALRARCTRQNRCEAPAERGLFLDQHASQVSKYLRVWHECIPEESGILGLVRKARRSGLKKREFYLSVNGSNGSDGLASLRDSGLLTLDKSNQQQRERKQPQKRAGASDGMMALKTILEKITGSTPV